MVDTVHNLRVVKDYACQAIAVYAVDLCPGRLAVPLDLPLLYHITCELSRKIFPSLLTGTLYTVQRLGPIDLPCPVDVIIVSHNFQVVNSFFEKIFKTLSRNVSSRSRLAYARE